MSIIGIEGMTDGQVYAEIQRGARFVVYQYCISCVILTFKRGSDIYFVRPEESAVAKGLAFTALSAALGWWGIPWGPIYTIQSLYVNLTGGRDVTAEIMASVNRRQAQPQVRAAGQGW
jgi:hypothetical protein